MSGRNNGWEIILNVKFSCCDTDGGGFFAPFPFLASKSLNIAMLLEKMSVMKKWMKKMILM